MGESGIWVNGRMREVERLGPFRILERDWDLGYICRLRSFTMVSCMLLSHGSQAVQTSRFSAARVPMNTWGGFGNVVCRCNFVICTVKYTHTPVH